MEKLNNEKLGKLMAYTHIYAGYVSIFFATSYYIQATTRPLGWFFSMLAAGLLILLYALINHIFVRLVVSHKILFLFESFLMISLCTQFLCYTSFWD